MSWILRIAPGEATTDSLSELLWALGTTGIAEIQPIAAPGRRELVAGFATEAQARAAASALGADPALGSLIDTTVEPMPAEAVSGDADDPAADSPTVEVSVAGQLRTIVVGPAFGDGGHATTALALGLLEHPPLGGARFCEFGAGTGILSVAAHARGARHVVAVEHEAEALAITRMNVEPLGAAAVVVRELPPVDRDDQSDGSARYDVIAANVLLPSHRAAAADLSGRLAPGGTLVTTGFLADQEAEVRALYHPLEVEQRRTDGDWVALTFRKPWGDSTGPAPGFGSESSEPRVWYAAFGSNLLRARMAVYLAGGPVPISPSGRIQAGARNPAPTLADRAIAIPHRLFFARDVASWGGGGVAFLDPSPLPPIGQPPASAPGDATLGRAWLVTADQFADVHCQENGLGEPLDLDLDALAAAGRLPVTDTWYGLLLHLGDGPDGSPVVTFTCPDPAAVGPEQAPNEPYRTVMRQGLGEAWGLDQATADAYLAARSPRW